MLAMINWIIMCAFSIRAIEKFASKFDCIFAISLHPGEGMANIWFAIESLWPHHVAIGNTIHPFFIITLLCIQNENEKFAIRWTWSAERYTPYTIRYTVYRVRVYPLSIRYLLNRWPIAYKFHLYLPSNKLTGRIHSCHGCALCNPKNNLFFCIFRCKSKAMTVLCSQNFSLKFRKCALGTFCRRD